MPPQIKKEQLKKTKQTQTNSPHAPTKKPKQNQTEKNNFLHCTLLFISVFVLYG